MPKRDKLVLRRYAFDQCGCDAPHVFNAAADVASKASERSSSDEPVRANLRFAA
jgi:poly(3-hydroxybutyrate) depolymerase